MCWFLDDFCCLCSGGILLSFAARISAIEGCFVDPLFLRLFGVEVSAMEMLALGFFTSCFDEIGVAEFLLVAF